MWRCQIRYAKHLATQSAMQTFHYLEQPGTNPFGNTTEKDGSVKRRRQHNLDLPNTGPNTHKQAKEAQSLLPGSVLDHDQGSPSFRVNLQPTALHRAGFLSRDSLAVTPRGRRGVMLPSRRRRPGVLLITLQGAGRPLHGVPPSPSAEGQPPS